MDQCFSIIEVRCSSDTRLKIFCRSLVAGATGIFRALAARQLLALTHSSAFVLILVQRDAENSSLLFDHILALLYESLKIFTMHFQCDSDGCHCYNMHLAVLYFEYVLTYVYSELISFSVRHKVLPSYLHLHVSWKSAVKKSKWIIFSEWCR